MLITFPTFDSAPVKYALCVIGAGPAGIIVALEYARQCPDSRILLAEFGGENQSKRNGLDEAIEVNNLVNHHAPYDCTNKGLGGSSITWGGRCVMYDRGDFHPRSLVGSDCTWNISFYEECLPYVAVTQRYFQSGSGPFDLSVPDGESDPVAPIAAGFRSPLISDTVVERWSLPTRFGSEYESELKTLPNLDLLLGAEARSIGVPDDSGRVSGVGLREVATGREIFIVAERVVLAMGAQEVTRLLLLNLEVFRRLQAPPPALGKYYQGHVSGKIASIRINGDPRATEYGFRREPDGSFQRRRFQFTEQALLDFDVPNTAFWLDNPLYNDPAHRSGAMSFMYLAMLLPIVGKRLAPPAVAHSITKGKVNRVGAHLENIARDFPRSLWTPASIFFRRYLLRRKLPGVFLYNPENCYALHFHAEQIPDTGNRMEIAADGKTLLIHYRVTTADAEGIIRAHERFDAELQRCGAGHLEYWFPPDERVTAVQEMSKDGVHQSGTTRIGKNSEEGVVDTDLLVWGTKNLYVCSSSVFPTSGQANPTFFTGVCAVRLAHHLHHAHR